jgi:hypothetical protein
MGKGFRTGHSFDDSDRLRANRQQDTILVLEALKTWAECAVRRTLIPHAGKDYEREPGETKHISTLWVWCNHPAEGGKSGFMKEGDMRRHNNSAYSLSS